MRATGLRGFTLIELMAVVAVLAILATLAIPSLQDRIVRAQIVEAVPLADIAKAPVALAWQTLKTMPPDNASLGLPPPEKVVSTLVTSTRVEDGAIHLVFGN